MPCPDQIRLTEDFEEADHAWSACRDNEPIDLRDNAEIYRLSQTGRDLLALRNAAAGRLYEHRIGCPICKSTYVKNKLNG
jgi:hypothetical protein